MTDARITEIRLPPAESSEHEVDYLCMWVDSFVSLAVDEFGYEPDELPDGAHGFAHLWTYHGECLNGGHAQYHGNTDGDVSAWRAALRVIERLDRPGYKSILEQFIQFSVENEDRLEELYEEDERAADRLFRDFDDRFYALEKENGGLKSAIYSWLVQQNWIAIDPDMPPSTMDRLRQAIPPHPLIEARKAARHRSNAAENHGANQAFLRRLLDRLEGNAKP